MSRIDDEAVKEAQALKDSLTTLGGMLGSWLARNRLSYRILVVDDSELMRMSIREILRDKLQVPVDVAATGADAVKQWRAGRHGVVVMDVQLVAGSQGESGVHVAHSLGRGPRIVLISGFAEEALLEETAQALDAEAFVKPFDIDKFVETVRRLLAKAARAPLTVSTPYV